MRKKTVDLEFVAVRFTDTEILRGKRYHGSGASYDEAVGVIASMIKKEFGSATIGVTGTCVYSEGRVFALSAS